MEKINCLICNSEKNNFYESVKDRFNLSDNYKIVKCICGFIFLNPRPDTLEIEKHYTGNASYTPHDSLELNFFNFVYRFVQKITFRMKKRKIQNLINAKSATLLDIGSGDGRFLKYLKNHLNINIFIDEPFTNSDFKSIKNNDTIKLDIVTMWHSLEHIHDIENIFNVIDKTLKEEGRLLIAVPNINAYELKYFKSNWIAYDAPRHLYHFSFNSLKSLLIKYNFQIIEKKPIYQDTLFNIILSSKSLGLYKMLKSFIYIPVSLFNIYFNNNSSSSILYTCKRK